MGAVVVVVAALRVCEDGAARRWWWWCFPTMLQARACIATCLTDAEFEA